MTCFMFDDMISTAGSICGAAKSLITSGAKEVYVAATHGVLCGEAIRRLTESPVAAVAVTDTIPLAPEKMIPKMRVLTVAPLLAEAIKRIHHDQSISALFEKGEDS